jgi:hypothetical protein
VPLFPFLQNLFAVDDQGPQFANSRYQRFPTPQRSNGQAPGYGGRFKFLPQMLDCRTHQRLTMPQA